MAGPATAAISSSISSSLKYCVTSKSCWPSFPQQRISVAAALSKSNLTGTLASRRIVSRQWRAPRVLAAQVIEGEAPAITATEEAGAAEEEEEEEEETQQPAVNTKLYFGNLPYNVDSAELAGIIQDYASPELVEVLYDRETGRGRGFAFVTMSTVEECNTVIQNLDGKEYLGRILKVNFSDKPRPKEPLYPETEHKLFVGNLSWSVTADSLTKAFQQYGTVVGARVLYDGETGRSRGYGFVCYQTKSEMETALDSLNGFELEGRAIRVYLAEAKR